MTLDFWKFVHRQLENGKAVFLAHVAHNTRHSPGTAGAQMAVTEEGQTFGTIGGGIMEADVLRLADEALGAEEYAPRHKKLYHRKKSPHDGEISGLGCAGNQTNVYHIVKPGRDSETVERIVDCLEIDAPGLVVISPQGLELQSYAPVGLEAPYRFLDSDPWRFSSQLLNWKRIAIIGGGHCGLALSRVMNQLGYSVSLFDTRPDVFTFQGNEFAHHRITVDDYAEAGSMIEHPAWTHVVVMTANVESDIDALYGIAERPFAYIGVMGAPAKLTRINSELAEMGISKRALDALYAPVGLEMTSDTPEEIAISVAGQILAEREKLFAFARPPEN